MAYLSTSVLGYHSASCLTFLSFSVPPGPLSLLPTVRTKIGILHWMALPSQQPPETGSSRYKKPFDPSQVSSLILAQYIFAHSATVFAQLKKV